MAAARHRCCRGPPLKYRVRYSRSRQRHHFRYLASDTLGRTILCRPLFHKIWSSIHQSRRIRSSKCYAVNIFLPNTPTVAPPCVYHHHTNCHASLLHRWELPVLRYHSIRINYPYSFFGVIFGWFCMILWNKITIKTVKFLPFFSHYGKLPDFLFKLRHFIFSDVFQIFLFPPKILKNV